MFRVIETDWETEIRKVWPQQYETEEDARADVETAEMGDICWGYDRSYSIKPESEMS